VLHGIFFLLIIPLVVIFRLHDVLVGFSVGIVKIFLDLVDGIDDLGVLLLRSRFPDNVINHLSSLGLDFLSNFKISKKLLFNFDQFLLLNLKFGAKLFFKF